MTIAALAVGPPAIASGSRDVSVSGTVTRIVDDPNGNHYVLNTSTGLITLPHTFDAKVASGDTVHATVRTTEPLTTASSGIDAAAISKSTVIAVDVVKSAMASGDLATHIDGRHTLVLAPIYAGSSPPVTQSDLQNLAESVATFYANETHGALTFTIDVRPWKKISDYADCGDTLYNNALALHGIPIPSSTGRTHVAVIIADQCASWAGLAGLNGRQIWIGGYFDPLVLAHEMGHNLGLQHSNELQCANGTTPTLTTGTCTQVEYGDSNDTMGSATLTGFAHAFSTPQADRLGLLQSVPLSTTATSTVQLQPVESHTGIRAATIPYGNETLYIEYRPDVIDLGSSTPYTAGIQVLEAGGALEKPLRWRAGTPTATTSQQYVPIDPTSATVLPGTGTAGHELALSVVGLGATATIETVPVSSDTTNPTTASLNSPAPSAGVSTTPTFTWTKGTDAGSGVAGERINITGAALATPLALRVPAGASSFTLDAAHPLTPSSYTWSVTTTDRTGRSTTSTSRAFVVESDPPAPATITSTWDPCSSAPQTISWSGGFDTYGPLSYRLIIDNVPQPSTTQTSATLSPADLGPGRHVIVLRTFDAAGNHQDAAGSIAADVDVAPPTAPTGMHLLPDPDSGGQRVTFTSLGSDDTSTPSVTFAVDGVTYDVGFTPATYSFSAGTTSITVKSVDQCGRSAADQVVPLQAQDVTAPSAPAIIPATGGYTRSNDVAFTWAPAVDAQSGIDQYEVSVDGSVWTQLAGDATSFSGAYSTSLTGTTTVGVRARNGQGLWGPEATTVLTFDDQSPTEPTILSPASGTASSSPVIVTWTAATDPGGSGVAGYRLVYGDKSSEYLMGTTSAQIDLPAGLTTVYVEARDKVGNVSSAFEDVTIASSSAGVQVSGPTTVDAGYADYTIVGSSTAPIGAGRAALVTFTRKSGGPTYALGRFLLAPKSGGGFTTTVTLPLFASGTLHVSMDEPDAPGVASDALAVTVNPVVTPPPPPPPSPTALSGWGSGTRVAKPGSTLTYSVKATPGTGRSMRLESRTCTTCSWALSTTRTTNASSIASVPVPVLAGTRYWRVVAPATSTALAATSATLTVIPSSTIAGWSTTTVTAKSGTTTRDGVTITPVKSRTTTLQDRTCSTCTWKNYRTARTSTAYAITWTIPVLKGTRYWRVYAPTVNGGYLVASASKRVIGR